jgi:CDP-glucose 4,6-dehydratase
LRVIDAIAFLHRNSYSSAATCDIPLRVPAAAKCVRMNLLQTYRGRRVLITGHTGFKGGWLSAWLNELDAKVTGLALAPSTQPSLFDSLNLSEHLDSRIVDIRDSNSLRLIVGEVSPDIIFHLAAQPIVRESYADPITTFATNILGTAHVLEAARTTPSVRALVSVTTDKVYENRDWPWAYREIDSLGGLDPYSASKACAELVSAVYQKNLCRGTIAIATARGGNALGGGDWSVDRIVPDIVRAIVGKEPIVLRNPDAVRPWQHVLELCEGYLQLGAELLHSGEGFAEAWNFGPHLSETVTVAALTRAILEFWGCPAHPVEVEASKLREAHILHLDVAKVLSRLAWRPRLNMRQALLWTVRWYQGYYDNPLKAYDLTRDQIRRYDELASRSPKDRS